MLKPSIINVLTVGLMAYLGVWVIDRTLRHVGLGQFTITGMGGDTE